MGVRVGTSIGRNKLHPGIDEVHDLKPWTTFRKSVGDVHAQEARYHRQLDEKRAKIEADLLRLGEKHPDQTLVFLCYEVLSGAKAYCHREWLSRWLTDRFGVSVPELGKNKKPGVSALVEEPRLL